MLCGPECQNDEDDFEALEENTLEGNDERVTVERSFSRYSDGGNPVES